MNYYIGFFFDCQDPGGASIRRVRSGVFLRVDAAAWEYDKVILPFDGVSDDQVVFDDRVVRGPGFPRGSASAVLVWGLKLRESGEPKARPLLRKP